MEDTFILYNRALYFSDEKELKELISKHGLKYINLLLYTSILNDDKTDVELLLKVGADTNFRICDGDPVLHKAALHSSPAILDLLLDYGADPWMTNSADEFACFVADLGGCEENANLLRNVMDLRKTTLLSNDHYDK